jgi:hypothetical protein
LRWLIVRITQVQPDAQAVAMDRGLPVLLEDQGARKVAKAVRLKFVDIGSLVLAAARNLPLAGGDLRYLLPPWRSASGHFRPLGGLMALGCRSGGIGRQDASTEDGRPDTGPWALRPAYQASTGSGNR